MEPGQGEVAQGRRGVDQERRQADVGGEVEVQVGDGDGQAVEEGADQEHQGGGGQVELADPSAGQGQLALDEVVVLLEGCRFERLFLLGGHRATPG